VDQQVGGGVLRGAMETRRRKGSETTSLREERTGVRETRINCEWTKGRVKSPGVGFGGEKRERESV
jgi:hypothetical protein